MVTVLVDISDSQVIKRLRNESKSKFYGCTWTAGRVVQQEAGLLLTFTLQRIGSAETEPSARFDGLAEIGVEPAVDKWIVAHG